MPTELVCGLKAHGTTPAKTKSAGRLARVSGRKIFPGQPCRGPEVAGSCRVSRHRLKARESRGRLVEGQSAGAARSGAAPADRGLSEGAVPLFERDHGGKDFLFVFHDEHVSLQRALDGG